MIEISIEKAGSGQAPPPQELVGRHIDNFAKLQDVSIGVVASLDEERLSEEAAEKGLWQPFASVSDFCLQTGAPYSSGFVSLTPIE